MHHLFEDVVRLTVWLAILAAIFVPLERLLALSPGRRTRESLAVDLGYYFVNGLVPALVLSFPAAWCVAAAHRILPGSYLGWVAGLPLWVRIAATFVIGDVGSYWGHRWSHALPWLWRFHAVHHRPDHLDWLVNSRGHPVDMIFTRLCGLMPVYLLGLAGGGGRGDNLPAILFVLAGTIWSFLIHANIRWAPRWLEPLLSTPRFHHWHHTKSGPIDRNYAAMLPWLDRLFGTHHMPRGVWPDDYGIRDEPAATTTPAPHLR